MRITAIPPPEPRRKPGADEAEEQAWPAQDIPRSKPTRRTKGGGDAQGGLPFAG